MNYNVNNLDLNLYNILELDSNASPIQIKKAYRKLALKYHPDKNKLINNDKFIKIQHAYEILSNDELKKQYDFKIQYENQLNGNIFNNIIMNNIINFFGNDYSKLKELIKNKIIENEINYEKFGSLNLFYSLYSIFDIKVKINFTLKEVYNNEVKLLEQNRITREKFIEYIYPIDKEQLYEKEGEIMSVSGIIIEGNLQVIIEINETEYNGINYYIIGNDLYCKLDKKNITEKYIIINFLDDKIYNFNINDYEYNLMNNGIVYKIPNMGLYYYKTDDEIINIKNGLEINRGNLFFIVLI
jgi:DnaJ-class molecular chaperone